jgi:hypothetical protein
MEEDATTEGAEMGDGYLGTDTGIGTGTGTDGGSSTAATAPGLAFGSVHDEGSDEDSAEDDEFVRLEAGLELHRGGFEFEQAKLRVRSVRRSNPMWVEDENGEEAA